VVAQFVSGSTEGPILEGTLDAITKNEILTGLLVIGTIAVVLSVLLGAPGLFRPLVTYQIYFDNAAGLKQGAPVMLAGRRLTGQKLFSPVTPQEEKQAEANSNASVEANRVKPTSNAGQTAIRGAR
jgi:hypothetical protein